jgi:hypothetical protein
VPLLAQARGLRHRTGRPEPDRFCLIWIPPPKQRFASGRNYD